MKRRLEILFALLMIIALRGNVGTSRDYHCPMRDASKDCLNGGLKMILSAI